MKNYDYTQQGAYFVTICTQLRECFFDIPAIRQTAEQSWIEIPQHFSDVELDEWIVMPNHVHGILLLSGRREILNARSANNRFSTISPYGRSLAVVIRAYKAAVSKFCRRAGNTEFAWQSNYYEHIIRSETDLNRVRQYILDNPAKWDEDAENPKRIS
ncbi:MAG: transposase [Anaerolineae bacterium]|nr:transposase [Anaerolineae bacterium]